MKANRGKLPDWCYTKREESPPNPNSDPYDSERFKSFSNRNKATKLTKEEVSNTIKDPIFKHPFKRTLVKVKSDTFLWACRTVTDEIIKAKQRKKAVIHFECCDIIWIGDAPRVCTHLVNTGLRKQLDHRAQVEKRYNPNYLPVSPLQYVNAGATEEQLDERIEVHLKEEIQLDQEPTFE